MSKANKAGKLRYVGSVVFIGNVILALGILKHVNLKF